MEGILTPPFAAAAPRSRPHPGAIPLAPGAARGLPVAYLSRAPLCLTIPGAHRCKGGALRAIVGASGAGRVGSVPVGLGRFRSIPGRRGRDGMSGAGRDDTRAGRSVPACPVLWYERGGLIPPRFRPGLRYDWRSIVPGIAPGHRLSNIPTHRRGRTLPVHTVGEPGALQLAG